MKSRTAKIQGNMSFLEPDVIRLIEQACPTDRQLSFEVTPLPRLLPTTSLHKIASFSCLLDNVSSTVLIHPPCQQTIRRRTQKLCKSFCASKWPYFHEEPRIAKRFLIENASIAESLYVLDSALSVQLSFRSVVTCMKINGNTEKRERQGENP